MNDFFNFTDPEKPLTALKLAVFVDIVTVIRYIIANVQYFRMEAEARSNGWMETVNDLMKDSVVYKICFFLMIVAILNYIIAYVLHFGNVVSIVYVVGVAIWIITGLLFLACSAVAPSTAKNHPLIGNTVSLVGPFSMITFHIFSVLLFVSILIVGIIESDLRLNFLGIILSFVFITTIAYIVGIIMFVGVIILGFIIYGFIFGDGSKKKEVTIDGIKHVIEWKD